MSDTEQTTDPSAPAWATVIGYLEQAQADGAAVDPSALIVLMNQLQRGEYPVADDSPPHDVQRDAIAYVQAHRDGHDLGKTEILASYGPIVGTDTQALLDAVAAQVTEGQ